MNHLDPQITKLAEEQNKRGGVQLDKLPFGTIVEARTKNSLYRIKAIGYNEYEVSGGGHFREPVITSIAGSTWGGSLLKTNWLGVGMHIEFPSITTTPVQTLKVIAPDGSWEYDL